VYVVIRGKRAIDSYRVAGRLAEVTANRHKLAGEAASQFEAVRIVVSERRASLGSLTTIKTMPAGWEEPRHRIEPPATKEVLGFPVASGACDRDIVIILGTDPRENEGILVFYPSNFEGLFPIEREVVAILLYSPSG